MVKAYLNYLLDSTFGSVATNLLPRYPIITVDNKLCTLVAADERVYAICIKTHEIQYVLKPESDSSLAVVTAIDVDTEGTKAAVGYSNGSILVFSLSTQTIDRTIDNNSRAIGELCFIASGILEILACAAIDNTVNVYDIGLGESLFSLKGHQSPVVGFAAFNNDKSLLTIGKDGIIRVWDLSNGTLQGVISSHKSELTGGVVIDLELDSGNQPTLALFTNDEEILLYKLQNGVGTVDEGSREIFKRAHYRKIIQFQKQANTLFMLNDNGELETCGILSKEEVAKKYKRKVKREVKDLPSETEFKSHLTNYFTHGSLVKLNEEARRFKLFSQKSKQGVDLYLITYTGKNHIERWHIKNTDNSLSAEKVERVESFGHTHPVQAMVLSSDDAFLLTGSADCLFLWETGNSKAVKRFDFQNCSALAFLPKDRFAIVGTKTGKLALLDIYTAEFIYTIDFNDSKESGVERPKDVKSISINDIRIFTQPQTKTVEVFVISSDRRCAAYKLASKSGKLFLKQSRSFRLHDEPLRLVFTPDLSQLMVSFVDNSIKVYHSDSFKEHVSLYGHALPVVDFDISTDGYILASISNDKTIRIWDRDFGNCRRIINKVHENGVYSLKIFSETHYALTCGKDGLIKFWDLDSFEMIMVFEHIMGESVRNLAISSIGDFFVAAGINRTIRKYFQTREQIYAEETRERLQEEQMVTEEFKNTDKNITREVVLKKFENLKEAEQFMDLIEDVETKHGDEQREFEADLILGKKRPRPDFKGIDGLNPAESVLSRLDEVNRNALEAILVFFHFKHMKALLHYVAYAVDNCLYEQLCFFLLRFIIERHRTSLLQTEDSMKLVRRVVKKMIANMGSNYKNTTYNLAGLTIAINELKMLG